MSFGPTPKSSDVMPLGAGSVPDSGGVLSVFKMANAVTDSGNNALASICLVADATTILNQASAAKTATGNTADLSVGAFRTLLIGYNVTAVSGSSPTLQFSLEVKGPDAVYYIAWTGASHTTQPQVVLATVGPGATNTVDFGATARIKWTIGGSSPSWTFSLWCIGK
jgi:hypothetical protein